MKNIALINRNLHDLNPLIVGEEACCPCHKFGPAIRNYTLIHFVSKGKGTFTREGVDYEVRAGEAFIIREGEITTYIADEKEPWTYNWVCFDGELSHSFNELPAVVPVPRNWAREMLDACENDGMKEYRIAALLFEMYAEMLSKKKPQNHYVRRVKNYIDNMYMQKITVEGLAQMLNMDRRYLSRLFKSKIGKSIQEYIISVRIDEAKRRLDSGSSVFEAAVLCGYEDVCNFSKMFKRLTGKCPKAYKQSQQKMR